MSLNLNNQVLVAIGSNTQWTTIIIVIIMYYCELKFSICYFYFIFNRQWDLVCAKNGIAELTQTCYVIGQGLGALTFPVLIENFGRRSTHIICGFFFMLSGFICALSPNLWIFIPARIFSGILEEVSWNKERQKNEKIMKIFESFMEHFFYEKMSKIIIRMMSCVMLSNSI